MTAGRALCEICGVHRRLALAPLALMLGLGCSAPVARHLSEGEASALVATLERHGIAAETESTGGPSGLDVRVPTSDVGAALDVLAQERRSSHEAPGLSEAFAEPSLVPTAGEERARIAAAQAADLERSLATLPGVEDARVHLGVADPSVVAVDDPAPETVASVLVHTEPGASVDEASVRALVAGAVPGLAPARVTVVAAPAPAELPAAPFVHVGPLAVATGSAWPLRGLLAALLGTNVLLAGGLVFLIRRSRAR